MHDTKNANLLITLLIMSITEITGVIKGDYTRYINMI